MTHLRTVKVRAPSLRTRLRKVMSMRFARVLLICGVAVLPAGLPAPLHAGAAPATAAHTERCQAARDRAFARLAEEEHSIRTMFDTEAAAIDAPTYSLEKAQRALIDELHAERRQADQHYRQCMRGGAPAEAR